MDSVQAPMTTPDLSGQEPRSGSSAWHPRGRGNETENLWFALDQAASISVSDVDGDIIFVNDKFLQTTKYSREEVLGKNHRILNSGYHSPEFFAELWRTIGAGRIWRDVMRNKAKDGAFFWIDCTIIPFLGDDGRPYQYLAIRHDVTKEKLAEATERLTALGEMQASIAHEIRNPLAVVRLHSQLMKMKLAKGPVPAETLRDALTKIEAATGRIEKIIRGIQAFSRNADADPFELATAQTIVEDALEFCRPGLEKKGISIGADFCPEPAAFLCRPAQISQVLLNLINNARDAIDGHEARWIRVRTAATDHAVTISVTDSGPGIPAEVLPRIMEPFFSTKPAGKGSGLGLSISRKIIDAHGGRLRLDLQSPHTCFVLEFPRAGD